MLNGTMMALGNPNVPAPATIECALPFFKKLAGDCGII